MEEVYGQCMGGYAGRVGDYLRGKYFIPSNFLLRITLGIVYEFTYHNEAPDD